MGMSLAMQASCLNALRPGKRALETGGLKMGAGEPRPEDLDLGFRVYWVLSSPKARAKQV